MTVLYNTNYTHNPNSYLTLAVLDAAHEVFGDSNVVLADNRSLVPLAASGAHDVLICLDGQRLHEGLLRRVRHAFRCVVLWQFEDPFMLDYNLKHVELFDHVFTNDPACVASYGAKGHYLPLAASQRLHFRPVKPDAELDYDIFFAGTMWPNRIHSLRRVIGAFPDARLKLVCPTNEYLPPLPSDLARRAIQWPISHEAFIDFANASRVTVTMFRDYASHGDVGQATAPGPRLYELALAGTAQVVQCGDAMDRAHFDATPGVGVVGDPAQLVDSIRSLLASPASRAERARQTQRQVATAQLYTHRLRGMREVAGARFEARAPAATPPTGRKLRVLMCTHSTMHRNEWGGVEVYQQTLCSMFEREIDVLFWLRRDGQCQLMDDRGVVLERFDMHEIGWLDSLTDAPEEVAFSNVIGQYGIDLVHFQHLGHHAASLPIIAKSAGVGIIFSAHDFFLICSRYNLLNHEQVFCDIGHKSISACDICLRTSENLQAGAQQTRRAFMAEMIRSIDVFLFGTAYSEWLSMRVYPELAHRRRAVLGIPMPPSTVPPSTVPPSAMIETHAADAGEAAPLAAAPLIAAPLIAAPLVIAVVGNVLRAKGADALISLIEEANPQLFRFHVLGHAEPAYADVFAQWNKPNVTYHGRYAPGDLAKVAGADVALHLSIWPETYCISLSEVWQAGLIPIASDIGAFGDRIEHGKNGFKVGVGDTSAVLDTLELLRASPATRRVVRANIGPHLWTDTRAYAASLLEIYRSVTPARPLGDAGLGLDAGQVHLLAHPSWKILAPPRHIFDPSRRSSLRLELSDAIQDWSHIQGSEVYIDAVCGQTPAMLSKNGFEAAETLHVSGWTFVPDVRVGGQVELVLIGDGEGPIIFFDASRDIRDDIMSKFAAAPRRSGFAGGVALRGKWCEGSYRVALVNSFGDRAGFCLTQLQVKIEAGKVKGALLSPPSNDAVIRAFYRVCEQTGEGRAALPRLPIKLDAWRSGQLLRHHIDSFCDNPGLSNDQFHISGWAFLPDTGLAGRLYVGLVDMERCSRILLPAPRIVRSDLATYFSDAPLCGGFATQIETDTGWPDGTYVCSLVNLVSGIASTYVTDYELKIKAGRIETVVEGEASESRTARVRALLCAAPLATAPVVAPVVVNQAEVATGPASAGKAARDNRRKTSVRQASPVN